MPAEGRGGRERALARESVPNDNQRRLCVCVVCVCAALGCVCVCFGVCGVCVVWPFLSLSRRLGVQPVFPTNIVERIEKNWEE